MILVWKSTTVTLISTDVTTQLYQLEQQPACGFFYVMKSCRSGCRVLITIYEAGALQSN